MTASPVPSTRPVAELDRRFYAFAVDRLIVWGSAAAAAVGAWFLLIEPGQTAAGVLVVLAVVLVVGGVFAVLLGLRGTSPGNAVVGIRVVREGSGIPIGVGPALVRQLILAFAGLPTFGLGLATLAWTAVADPTGRRRGWHDHVAHSVVLDTRPAPAEELVEDVGPQHIVNLTAMRLVPAPQRRPVAAPVRSPRPPSSAPAPSSPQPAAAAVAPAAPPRHVAPPRQQLGYPLVPEPPAPTPAPAAPDPASRVGVRHSTAERTVTRDGGSAGPLSRWRVSFDTGEAFLVEGLALVGRRPEPRAGEPVRHLVPLRSEDMSLSKTHAQFQVASDGVLVVMDRGSTNGSILIRQGVPRELAAGAATTLVDGDLVRFGDREMVVVRES